MTPYVLLLFHLLYPYDFRTILSERVIDTVIGSAIAFVANIFLLPSRERGADHRLYDPDHRGQPGLFPRCIGGPFLAGR